MGDTQPFVEEANSSEVNDEGPGLREQLPPLLLCPLSEGSGRVLRYRSGLSLRSPLSQPLIRQSNNCGIGINDDVFPVTESRAPEQSSHEIAFASGAAGTSAQSPQDGTGMFRPAVSNNTHSIREDYVASIDRETVPFVAPLHGMATQSNSSRPEQRQTSVHSAYFTIGDQDDSQAQMNVPTDNDASLPIDLVVAPPSYETVCQKKTLRDSNGSSRNTIDSLQLPTYRDAIGRGRYLEDAPPNYHALFAHSVFRMMDITNDLVGQSADGEERSFCFRISTYVVLAGIVIFIAGMTVPLPLAMVAIGVTHLHSCPAQPRIPVFLTSLGVFQLLECVGRLSMYIYSKLRSQTQREDGRYRSKDPFVYFIVVWFIVGSMWVYQNYPSCHEIIPQSARAVGSGGAASSGNQSTVATNFAKIMPQNAYGSNKTLRPTVPATGNGRINLHGAFSPSKQQSLTWQVSSRSLPTTAGAPEERQKAACCGKLVYFFTFGVVTFYYSIVGILFLLQICGNFVHLVCRCRGGRNSRS